MSLLVPAVVGDDHVLPSTFVLSTVKSEDYWWSVWSAYFYVEDENKNCVYLAHKSATLSTTTIQLRDTNNVPVVCLRSKGLAGNWKLYRGSEIRDDALLFTCKQPWSKSNIYLPANVGREHPDFTVKVNAWNGRDFKLLYHDQLIIAETTRGGSKKTRKLFITAVPNMDKAFIAAILVMMEAKFEKQV